MIVVVFRKWKATELAAEYMWDTIKLRFPMRIGRHRAQDRGGPLRPDARHPDGLRRADPAGARHHRQDRGQPRDLRPDGPRWPSASARAQPLATPLARTGVFPVMVTQMLAVGEETGAVDTMLHKLADFYDDEVATMLKSLTSIIEPIMMIGVGGIVGVVVIAMYLPMFKIFELVQ